MISHRLQSLTIAGYKSIKDLKDLKLNSLNVLTGTNGAGKTNLLTLFRLANKIYEQQLQLYVAQQGGADALLHFGRDITKQLYVKFCFNNNDYELDLIPTADNRLVFKTGYSESNLKGTKDAHEKYTMNTVANWRVYHFHDTGDTARIKQLHAINDNLRLKEDGANLAAYLKMLKDKHFPYYKRIIETIRLAMPFFDNFLFQNNEYIQLEWVHRNNPNTPFKAHYLSDGTLRFICLITLLLQPPELLPETILIDEPEIGLHPNAINILVDIFKQVAEIKQLVVATQSTALADQLLPEHLIMVTLNENGTTQFKRY